MGWQDAPKVEEGKGWESAPVVQGGAEPEQPEGSSFMAGVRSGIAASPLGRAADLSKIGAEFLSEHPTLATAAGGIGGAMLGGPAGGWLGMTAGGALGAAGTQGYSQIAQHALENPEAPQTSGEAAGRVSMAGAEGAVTGLAAAGGLAGAPAVVRAAGSPLGIGALSGAVTLAKTGSPQAAGEAAILGAVTGGHGLSKLAGKALEPAAQVLERLALKMRIGNKLIREAPEAMQAAKAAAKVAEKEAPVAAAATKEAVSSQFLQTIPVEEFRNLSSKLPGRVIVERLAAKYGVPKDVVEAQLVKFNAESAVLAAAPAPAAASAPTSLEDQLRASLRTPPKVVPIAPKPQEALAEELQTKVLQWREAGLSKGQMADAMSQLYKIPKGPGGEMVDMILNSYKVAR